MAFRWSDYLELAGRLAATEEGDECREAAMRSAVSRAYYAAYCHVLAQERERGAFEAGPTYGRRKRFHDHLNGAGMRRISDRLRELQRWREKCDYEDDVQAAPLAMAAVNRAAAVLRDHL